MIHCNEPASRIILTLGGSRRFRILHLEYLLAGELPVSRSAIAGQSDHV
jgi:hypothetical protein